MNFSFCSGYPSVVDRKTCGENSRCSAPLCYIFQMSRKSIVEIRNSEIRLKSSTRYNRQRGSSDDGSSTSQKRSNITSLMQSRHRKKQRRLFEFNIPTVAELPVKQRNRSQVDVNGNQEPILIDDEEGETHVEDDASFEEHGHDTIQGKTTESVDLENGIVEISFEEEKRVDENYCVEEEEEIEEIRDEFSAEHTEVEAMRVETTPEVIICPICNQDLSNFELYEREAHCEKCIEGKGAQTTNIVSSNEYIETLHVTTSASVDIVEKHQGSKKISKTATNKKAAKPQTKRHPKPKAPLPRIKILTFNSGYKLVVDGFNYADDLSISKYFLSHFHSDHYVGLKKSWEQGEIYCSQITSDLLQYKFKVPSERICILINNEKHWVTDTICVTAFDANHCPGAQVYLFQEFESQEDVSVPIKQIIHTGDFRSNNDIINEFGSEYKIDSVYLDTTYLAHTNNFPLQKEIVNKTSEYITEYFKRKDEAYKKQQRFSVVPPPSKKLVLVGAYAIGKEKLALGICSKLNCHCFVYNQELRSHYMDCGNQERSDLGVHLVPLSVLKNEETILRYLKDVVKVKWLDVMVVGVIPTGWTYGNMWESRNLTLTRDEKIQYTLDSWNKENNDLLPDDWYIKQLNGNKKFQIFKVPYSEHSSFYELARFATSGKIKWEEMLATVNMDSMDRVRDMSEWFSVWKKINESKIKPLD